MHPYCCFTLPNARQFHSSRGRRVLQALNELQLMCNMFVNAGRCTSRDTMPEMFSLYIFRLILVLGYSLAPNIVLNNQGFLD
jgi:hypothetical protein